MPTSSSVRLRWRDFWMACWFALMCCLPVQAANVPLPPLNDWVTDTTGTLNRAQQQAMSQELQALQLEKGAQLFVLVVPTTGNDSVENYARRVFDAWKVGRKKVDDGVLLLVAKDDRRLRIEVGYGLEGAITDLQAGRIIREQITPYFAQGDYAAGIAAGVASLSGLIRGESLPPVTQSTDDDESPAIVLIPLAFFALVMPVAAAALMAGVFVFILFESLPLALIGAVVGVVISLIGYVIGAGGRRSGSGRASKYGGALDGLASHGRKRGRGNFPGGGGFGGGGGGFGGGGGGGGFGGGGGGGSGGGGASGSW